MQPEEATRTRPLHHEAFCPSWPAASVSLNRILHSMRGMWKVLRGQWDHCLAFLGRRSALYTESPARSGFRAPMVEGDSPCHPKCILDGTRSATEMFYSKIISCREMQKQVEHTFPVQTASVTYFFNPYLRTCLLIWERETETERKRERHRCERGTLIRYLLCVPLPRTEPAV